MDFSRYSTISFDCYGTIIEWEAGILPVVRGILKRHGKSIADAEILELYGEFEAAAESGAYQPYRDVLRTVVRRFGDRFDFKPTEKEVGELAASLPEWPPFDDSVEALRKLKSRYKLVVISNIDDDLLAETKRHLDVEFDAVITAQQARSYKPSRRNFEMALDRVKSPPEQWLHAGQSIFHDVIPAQALGIAAVWVNRKSARPGVGAVRAATGKPDLEVPDLRTLAAMAVTQ